MKFCDVMGLVWLGSGLVVLLYSGNQTAAWSCLVISNVWNAAGYIKN